MGIIGNSIQPKWKLPMVRLTIQSRLSSVLYRIGYTGIHRNHCDTTIKCYFPASPSQRKREKKKETTDIQTEQFQFDFFFNCKNVIYLFFFFCKTGNKSLYRRFHVISVVLNFVSYYDSRILLNKICY